MGDTGDGPSIAAQSAQVDQTDIQPGLFARLRDAIRPPSTPEVLDDAPAQTVRAAGSVLGMLNLRRMRVEDVAVPKTDIVAVPLTITKDELVEKFRDCGLTRLPVYDGTLDTPIGFANLKDFALRHGFNGESPDLDLRKMVRPLMYVPPSMSLGVLLQKMQAERIHMALVIDEYVCTYGLLPIEDVIEQVVGAIEDEHDIEEANSWVLETPGCYLAHEEEVDTLGGLVTMLAGHLPARGEVIVHPEGPEFEVMDADPRRSKRLRIWLPNAARG